MRDAIEWNHLNPSFIPRLVLIVLSGTESNRRINFNPGLARFNPRLALIGFPGTGAWISSELEENYEADFISKILFTVHIQLCLFAIQLRLCHSIMPVCRSIMSPCQSIMPSCLSFNYIVCQFHVI